MSISKTQRAIVGPHGVKSLVSIGDFDQWMDQHIDAALHSTVDSNTYYKVVPWLFRATLLRAQAIAAVPFDILQGNTVIDTSDDYQDNLPFFKNPKTLLWLVEASLTLTGKAYLFHLHNQLMTLNLRYLVPTVIKPKITQDGLVGFTRKLTSTQTQQLEPEDLIYLWYPDPFVELGEPTHFPAQAAMAAAGVMMNLDRFAEAFFKRGAVKTSVLAVDGNPPQQERDRLKAWWNKLVNGGINNAFASEVVNASAVTVTPIGEGIKELENATLSEEKRQDIAAALTIPYTKLFSGSASGLGGGGVVDADDVRFATEFTIPEAAFIEDVLNDQVFTPMGYHLRFKPEALEVMQQNQSAKHSTLATMVGILSGCSSLKEFEAAAKLISLQIDDAVMLVVKDYFADKESKAAQVQAQTTTPNGSSQVQAKADPTQEPPANSGSANDAPDSAGGVTGGSTTAKDNAAKALADAQRNELTAYKRWRAKRVKDGKPLAGFTFQYLDPLEAAAEGEGAYKSLPNDPMAVVANRFQSELTGIVTDAWQHGGKINKDMRQLITQYVEDAFDAGLLDGGSSPDALDAAALVDQLVADQLQYVSKFAKDVQDAKDDPAQQDSIRRRITLWAENIYSAGQRGWAQAHATRKQKLIWNTANDELVCPVCAPLNGRVVEAGKAFAPGVFNEPAHPNCRCQTVPYLDENG